MQYAAIPDVIPAAAPHIWESSESLDLLGAHVEKRSRTFMPELVISSAHIALCTLGCS